MSALGDAIRDGLADAGLTQTQLADMLGVTTSTTSRWVLGQRAPSPTFAPVLAKILGRPEIETLASAQLTDRSEAQARAWQQRRLRMDPKPPKPKPERRVLEMAKLTPPRRNATHLVEDISFRPGTPADRAPMSCRCGWSGTAGDWMDHRREVAA